MLYPNEVIEEVRSGNEIVDVVGGYVALKQKGANHFGLCPFHNEKSPSFCVNTDKQIFHCFGCGAGGNVFTFIMQIENYDFMDALKLLADRIHYTLPQPSESKAYREHIRSKEAIADMHTKAARFFYDTLQANTAEAENARAYLDRRGIHPKVRVKFGLGLSPPGWDKLYKHVSALGYSDNDITASGLALLNKNKDGYYDRFRERLMFPIFDLNGRVVAFGGRIMANGEPKYLNSPETPIFEKGRQLYGLHLARKAKAKEIILVEGYMDAISLYQAGFTNTAGVLGTALTPDHTRLLRKIGCETAILVLDSDEAGTKAALKAIPVLLSGSLKVKVLHVPNAKDPDEYIRTFGRMRFAEALASAQSHIAFRVGLLQRRYDITQTDQRIAFTQETAALLSTLESAIETDAYITEVSYMTGIASEAIRAEVNRKKQGPSMDTPTPQNLRQRQRNRSDQQGLANAKKELLNLLLTNPAAARALARSDCLEPDDMQDKISGLLLSVAYDNSASNRAAAPADIISRFETLDEQKQAAELLHGTYIYGDEFDTEKALNEMVNVIKRARITQQMDGLLEDGKSGFNAVNKLLEDKRKLDKLYITMTDG